MKITNNRNNYGHAISRGPNPAITLISTCMVLAPIHWLQNFTLSEKFNPCPMNTRWFIHSVWLTHELLMQWINFFIPCITCVKQCWTISSLSPAIESFFAQTVKGSVTMLNSLQLDQSTGILIPEVYWSKFCVTLCNVF